MSVRGRLVFYEGWDLANSASFPSPRWTTSATGATVNVQSGGGRFALTGSTGAYGEFCAAVSNFVIPTPDYEIGLEFTLSNNTAEGYCVVGIGDSNNGGGAPLNGFNLTIYPAGDYYMSRRDSGGETNFGSGTQGWTASTAFRAKLRRERPYWRYKAWDPTAAEPDWGRSVVDYAYPSAANRLLMLGLFGGNVAVATQFTVNWMTITELLPGKRRPTLGR